MTIDTHAEACRLLRQAADLLDEVGLHQGDYWPDAKHGTLRIRTPYEPGWPCCGLGAIIAVGRSGGVDWRTPAADAATIWVEQSLPQGMAAWSDTPGRTAAEVSAHLRAVADAHEGDGDV